MNELLKNILENYKQIPSLRAIALGGSFSSKTFDKTSDIFARFCIFKMPS